eukprot:CFRG3173T1
MIEDHPHINILNLHRNNNQMKGTNMKLDTASSYRNYSTNTINANNYQNLDNMFPTRIPGYSQLTPDYRDPPNFIDYSNTWTQSKSINQKVLRALTPRVLIERWIQSYNGILPIAEVGAACGHNVVKAAMSGCYVVAIDHQKALLEFIADLMGEGTTTRGANRRVQTINASLPDLRLEDNSMRFSGIICSDLIQFLKGGMLLESFQRMFDLLSPGGTLVLTCAGIGMLQTLCGEDKMEWYKIRKESNLKWPGELRHINIPIQTREEPGSPKLQLNFIHVLEPDTICYLAEMVGFVVEICKYEISNKGMPTNSLQNQQRIHFVGVKPLASRNMMIQQY